MFTGAIKLANIDDYISPGQSCIQPKIMTKEKSSTTTKASVSLNDCLACSGCITSAESLLVEQMSISKLREVIEQQQQRDIYFLVAPQVLVSYAANSQKSLEEVLSEMTEQVKKLSSRVKSVYQLNEVLPMCHEMVFDEYIKAKGRTILCSECPGWVCYAEKTLNQQISDLMSTIKSPQQVMGRLVKQRHPDSYVVSVMACYDKKLEAIRFRLQGSQQHHDDSHRMEVDLTITAGEFLQLFPNDILQLQHSQQPLAFAFDRFNLDGCSGSNNGVLIYPDQASNGYLTSLLVALGVMDRVQSKIVKNNDFVEYVFEDGQGRVVKMARCYGFRNIQKIVQAVKKKKCDYAYVEIMACPGGCHNGGGQITPSKVPKVDEVVKEIIERHLHKIQNSMQGGQREHKQIDQSAEAFKTRYKPIEKNLTETIMNW